MDGVGYQVYRQLVLMARYQNFSPDHTGGDKPKRRQVRSIMAEVLVVDNNQQISRMFNEVLSRDGHKVTVARDGYSALRLIDKNDFEIAFIDIGLPDMNGLELLKLLNLKSPLTVSTVISGKSDINNAIESIKAGVFRYLKKPFDLDAITEIAGLAYQERINMVRSGYLPVRNKVSAGRQKLETVKLLIDLPLIILAILAGFLFQKEIYYWFEIPALWSLKEIIYLALSLACCYGFIYFQNPRPIEIHDKNQRFNHDFKNLSLTYAVFAAILFFVTNYIDSRIALICGYCLGLAGLLLNDYALLPSLDTILASHREGPRSIILKGMNKQTAESNKSYDIEKARVHDLLAKEQENKRPAKSGINDDTDHLDDSTLANNNQASGLIARFKGSRSRFDHSREKDKVEHISR
jgi:CheY-like chemotaxis protein